MPSALRLGLAVGRTSLTAVEVHHPALRPRPGRSWSFRFSGRGAGDIGQELAEPLAALRTELGDARVVAGVAFMRPLAQTKSVPVPRVGREALRALLARDPRRWFVVQDAPLLVDAGAIARGAAGARVTTVVCAVESTVAGALDAVRAAGFEIDHATAGAVALHSALRALVPAGSHGRVLVLAHDDDCSELLLLDDGALRVAQSVPRGEQEVAEALSRLRARGLGPASVMLLGGDAAAAGALAALTRLDAPAFHLPSALAAFGATLAGERSPLLLTSAMRAARSVGARRRTMRVLLAAAAMLVTAGALRQVDLARELAAVEARREAIAPAVEQAMVARRAVELSRGTIEAMASVDTVGPGWTAVLAAVARALPDSAYLLTLVAEGRDIRLSGAAVSAESAIPALEASPLLSGVSLSAPIRRDEEDGMEYFEVTAVVTAAGGR